jgi:hypothetical protein
MNDGEKTKEQLIDQAAFLSRRIAELGDGKRTQAGGGGT